MLIKTLEIASNIIAIIQIVNSIAKLCNNYIVDVKNVNKNIKRLQQKTMILSDVLQRIIKINNETKSQSLNLFDNV